MNVLIISSNRNQFPMSVVPIGACMVAEAAQKAGHNVKLLDLMFEQSPLQAIRKELIKSAPDVVGLSVRNIDNNDMQSPAFFIKDLVPLIALVRSLTAAPIVLGGAAVSVMPEELLRYTGLSLAVTGDGEVVFPKLLEELSHGRPVERIQGVACLEDGIFKSNPCLPGNGYSCPSPDYFRWINVKEYLSRLATMPLQTKLGCRFSCVYCTYRKIEGKAYRLGDPLEVAGTVTRMVASGLRHIEIVDNVFNSPYDHALEVCGRLAQVRPGVSLQSLELNPLFIDDLLLSSMKRAGFAGIGVTLESASDKVLEGLGKGFTTEHVYKASEVIKRHDLPCLWIFMLGGPNETRKTVMETVSFAEEFIRPRDVAFFGIGVRIYPGTKLESTARNQGLLSLSPKEMLEPVFYLSPEVDYSWMLYQIKTLMARHMNFISAESLSLPILPSVQRYAHKFGLSSPLWRHTRFIRRSLRLLGVEA